MRKPRAVSAEKERHWRKVFSRFQLSGLPFRSFCAQENISENTFQYWRRELRKRDETRGITSAVSKGDNRPSNLQEKIDFWLRIIHEVNSYSGSVRSYCLSHDIASGSLHFWEKRLKEMKLTNGITRHALKERLSKERKPGIQFSTVQVLDDISSPDDDRTNSNAGILDAAVTTQAESSERQLAAELVEPRSGYRVRIFNGADRSTLTALLASLAAC